MNNSAALVGGNGGKGGGGGINASFPSQQIAGGGGGGGTGGTGFILTGAGVNSNSGSITGGTGGAGGAGDVGGSGGDGGTGIVVTASGATIRNSGSISGGAGGGGGAQVSDIYSNGGNPAFGGTTGRPGAAGTGGTGIIGAGLTIINSGTITGGGGGGGGGGSGSGSGGSAQGYAIGFTGGANTLTSSGGTLSGNLGIANGVGASLTFLQTSAAGASGDVTISSITGLAGGVTDASVAIKTDGGRSLIITGASSYTGGTSVSDGSTLVIRNNNALGSGTLTMGETLAGLTRLVLDGNGFNIANTIVINSDPVITVAAGTTNTMSGAISGGGDVVLNGGGTLVLSGANTYTGGTTICGTACGTAGGSSVLEVGVNTVGTPGAIVSSAIGTGLLTFDGGTLQAGGNYTIANNAQINATGASIDANGYTFVYSGNIAGPGSLMVLDASGGAGRVVLTGTNTYTGGTTICDCATLQLGDATHIASIVGQVNVDGRFDIVNANTSGITRIVNDGFNGVATTTFHNATSASTAIIDNLNFGITQFRDSSTAGNATVSNSNGALTIFRDTSSAGSATFNNTNGGTVVFGDALGPPGGSDTSTAAKAVINNHDGGSTVFLGHTNAGQAAITNGNNGGSTQFFEFSSAASAAITTSATGYIAFFQNSTAANATIDNSGLTYFGTSGFSLTEAPTAGNATIINRSGAALIFDAYATAGNATITTESGANVKFTANSTGGTAQFITQGTGFVDFGGSLGPNGDGRITAGSIAGSGVYYIGGGNTLAVGGNNLSTVVSGVIADSDPCGCSPAGPGNLEKTGSGTLTLTGVNTYTGSTVVNGGILQVDGSIVSSSSVTVNSGGVLSGGGIVGNTTIASGGILTPGNTTPGTFLNVVGNLTFQSGALYLVGLNSTASTSAKVTGTATLAGSVGASVAAGSTIARQYTILSAAGGRSGTFAGVDSTGLPSGLIATLGYDANNAYLNFALDYATKSKLNVNQSNVATTLQNFFNANGGINVAYAGLSQNGLTQASGEGATGAQQATFNAMNQFLGLLTDPFVAGRDGSFGGGAAATPYAEESTTLAYAARKTEPRDALAAIYTKAPRQLDFDQRWSIWAAGYGGSQTTSGNAVLGSNNSSSSVYGTAVGADYRFSPNTIAGIALAGGGTSFSVNGLGWGRSDLFQAGAFVRHTVGAAYLSAALAYGWQDITTDRIVTAAGADHLRANFNANAWSGRLEGGYRYATPWMGLTPYAAAQFTSFELPSYAETVVAGGSGAFALNYAAKSVTDVRSELGLRSDKTFAVDSGILTLRGRVAWAHDFNPNRNVGAVFQALPGAAFVVNGAAQASDSALTTASLEMKWRNGWSAAATFEGEFSNVTQSYAGKGVMRYTW
nr:autotransporter domain-containing protein [Bradyrhizobium uaiense]